jgi:hypothetical protein
MVSPLPAAWVQPRSVSSPNLKEFLKLVVDLPFERSPETKTTIALPVPELKFRVGSSISIMNDSDLLHAAAFPSHTNRCGWFCQETR